MTIENMREALVKSKYNKSAWAKKVATMSDEQVMAIYFRMSNAGMFEKKQKVAISYGDTEPIHTVFYCHDCLSVYQSDNPNETECRICGGNDISNKPPRERIIK